MEFMEYLKFFGIGVLDGVIAGLLGIGGGVLIIPILLYITSMEVKVTTAISAVQVFFASSFGTLFNYLQRTINFRYAAIFGLSSAITYFFGSYFTKYIPGTTIKIIYLFAVVLAIILFFLKRNNKDGVNDNKIASSLVLDKKAYFKIIPIALAAGFAFGILGVGGGFLYVPLLVLLFNFPLRIAIGTSLAIVFFNAIPGIAGKLLAVRFDFLIGVSVAIGAIAGSRIGTYLNKKIKPQIIRIIFIILLAVIIIRVAIDLCSNFR